jgi:hypothetical protein
MQEPNYSNHMLSILKLERKFKRDSHKSPKRMTSKNEGETPTPVKKKKKGK